MLAVFLALKSFSNTISGKHVKLLVENTTAVTTINQMGTCHSRLNNQLAHKIWLWCIDHRVWLTVTHIPGKENTEADTESRFSRRETEWTLQKPLFNAAIKKLGVTPDVDLFASRLNFQLKPYVAYKPDHEAHPINAFYVSWKGYTFYALCGSRNIHTPPTEGFWFASPHPFGISVPRGSLMTPPPPRNFHVTRTWFLL